MARRTRRAPNQLAVVVKETLNTKNNGKKRPKKQRQKQKDRPLGRDQMQAVGTFPDKFIGGAVAKNPTPACFNALSRVTWGLPRAVGPYTIITMTRRINTPNRIMIFAPWSNKTVANSALQPTNIIAVGCSAANSSNPWNGSNQWEQLGLPAGNFFDQIEAVPCAFTVQVMNPNPLTTADGIITIGRLHTKQEFASIGATHTKEDVLNGMQQFCAPRLVSGGKLCLRGVFGSLVPYDMAELSNFRGVEVRADGNFTWDYSGTGTPLPYESLGMAPLFVYQSVSPVSLDYLVTVKYRVRFPVTNIAMATHVMHPISDDHKLHRAMSTFQELGHGIQELADTVGGVLESVAHARQGYNALMDRPALPYIMAD